MMELVRKAGQLADEVCQVSTMHGNILAVVAADMMRLETLRAGLENDEDVTNELMGLMVGMSRLIRESNIEEVMGQDNVKMEAQRILNNNR